MAVSSKNMEEHRKSLTEIAKSFLQLSTCSGGGRGWPQGSHVASGDLGGSGDASVGHMWSQGVAGGLGASGVLFGVTDGFVGSQIATGAASGLVGSWVAMGVCGWPLGVAVDLGGSRVTLITCQTFTYALASGSLV
jgi:hypothetical protein